MGRTGPNDGRAQRQIAAVMRELGWLPPTAAEQVDEQLKRACEAADLPAALADPWQVLEGERMQAGCDPPSLMDAADAADADAGLRRAAREGGELPADVLEAMRRDREQARGGRKTDPEAEG